jgi:hypothetical protein
MTTIIEQFNSLSSSVQYQISEYFMDQLRRFPNNPAFFVKADALANRLFEIVLTNPTLGTEADGSQSVQAKLQLSHIVIPEGEGAAFKLINTPKGKGNNIGSHSKGYYAPTMLFSKATIDAGLLSPSDLKALVNYCGTWAANGDNNYVAGSAAAKQRLWLTPRTSTQGYVTFILSERSDPQGNVVPALENFAWTAGDFHLIGSGVSENVVSAGQAVAVAMDAVGAAPAVAAGGRALV